MEQFNVLTDEVVIADGAIKTVDIELNVVVSRGADASVVKEKVEAAITEFFNIDKWDMGQALFVSNMVKVLENIDGVSYIDLFNPINNIIQNNLIVGPDSTGAVDGIGINQVIAEGKRVTGYYYEKLASTPNIS
jgi:phage-related baseplate assembly protein